MKFRKNEKRVAQRNRGVDVKASHGFSDGVTGSFGAAISLISTNQTMLKGDTVFVLSQSGGGPRIIIGTDL